MSEEEKIVEEYGSRQLALFRQFKVMDFSEFLDWNKRREEAKARDAANKSD
jgi:hypothetical protein